ncbi:MAG: esterase-like activity of phytase family protein [Pleurocapsa sp.]
MLDKLSKIVSDRLFLLPLKSVIHLFISLILLISLTACSLPKPVNANDRIFLPLTLEFLDLYELPKTTFKETPVGGLSAITYDRRSDRFYILSDDRSNRAPARFYTVKIDFQPQGDNDKIALNNLKIEEVTFLQDETGNNYPPGTIDPEGIALSPRGTVFITSEGDPTKNIQPFIAEFELKTGQKKLDLPIPQHYLWNEDTENPQGIQENLSFESLTIPTNGLLPDDPFRLFAANEASLLQDREEINAETQDKIRFLHYVINPFGRPVLVAEHLYLLEPASVETIANGLTELMALDTDAYFLSLERTFGFTGAGAKIFQTIIGNATDTSNIASLKGELNRVVPLKKQLLFDLQTLGMYIDNIEGMTLGPRLRDGSQSLILVSDDNFNEEQVTQFWLFRLKR